VDAGATDGGALDAASGGARTIPEPPEPAASASQIDAFVAWLADAAEPAQHPGRPSAVGEPLPGPAEIDAQQKRVDRAKRLLMDFDESECLLSELEAEEQRLRALVERLAQHGTQRPTQATRRPVLTVIRGARP
jgi:hypothetical protein